jgi:hypothetical protein
MMLVLQTLRAAECADRRPAVEGKAIPPKLRRAAVTLNVMMQARR